MRESSIPQHAQLDGSPFDRKALGFRLDWTDQALSRQAKRDNASKLLYYIRLSAGGWLDYR